MRPAGAVALPDTSTHVNRFEIKSETSDRIYVIAQSRSGRWWSCSCNGWLRHKTCKHLKALGLPTHHQPVRPAAAGPTAATCKPRRIHGV